MFLKEFTHADRTKMSKITQTLNENYDYKLNLDKMTKNRASDMITLIKSRITETSDLNKRIKLNLIAECLSLWTKAAIQTELTESLEDADVEEAKVILAAQEMSGKIQDMIEDAAKIQVQDLIPIIDAMRSEIGTAEADAFSQAADAAMSNIVEALKSGKNQFDDAISAAQGQGSTDMDDFSGDDNFDMDADMDMADNDGMDDMEDEFGGDATEVGGNEPTGRELKDEG